ncbi:uncharacterized protein LOC21391134 [Morus notabilis]|uniref:uncharacterized protein LOC21391134 n=1 Tax=Morus notabilis TaxID=981085 RepID=UPI000CED02C8|nr:uncharacterized protein LOC21391134 [Morus notabilis]
MALAYSALRICVLIISVLIFTSVFCTIAGKAEEYHEPEISTGTEDHEPEIGTGTEDHEPALGIGTEDHEPEIGAGIEHHEPTIGTGTEDHEPAIGAGAGAGAGTGTGAGAGAVGYYPAQIVAKALLCFNDKYIYSSCEESYRLTASGNVDVPRDMTDTYCGGPCLTETYLVLDCIDNILTHFVFYNKATIQDIRDTIHAGCGYGPERGDFNVEEHVQAEESNAQKVVIQLMVVLGLIVIGHGLLHV